jgi:hypothetical protein
MAYAQGGVVLAPATFKSGIRPYLGKSLSIQAHNVHTMGSEKRRVQFRAPTKLIDRTDALATVLGDDRTDILVRALREHLRDAAHDDEMKQEIAGAYYDDEITFEQLKSLVGPEEAANFRVLKQQLDEDFRDEIANL